MTEAPSKLKPGGWISEKENTRIIPSSKAF